MRIFVTFDFIHINSDFFVLKFNFIMEFEC